jgi:transposase InsO family protein
MTLHAIDFTIQGMCRALTVSRSGYYAWQRRGPSQHDRDDQRLAEHIRRIHEESFEAYGAIKIARALAQEGIRCGRHRVARIKREQHLETRRHRRFRVTTLTRKHGWIAPDRVRRHFRAAQPNQVWVGDVTCVRTGEGWLYLAVLLDLYSRTVVGWSTSARNDEALVSEALRMGIASRHPPRGLVVHTDRGRLYSSNRHRALMAMHGIVPSMGAEGDCYDNACAESFFSTLKNELLHHRSFATRAQTTSAIFAYITVFYNRKRLHQSMDYLSPEAIERGRMVA